MFYFENGDGGKTQNQTLWTKYGMITLNACLDSEILYQLQNKSYNNINNKPPQGHFRSK